MDKKIYLGDGLCIETDVHNVAGLGHKNEEDTNVFYDILRMCV